MNASELSASAESEIKQAAQRVWKVGTEKLPRVLWTFTKGAAAVCAAYWAVKMMPKFVDDLKALKDSHNKEVVGKLFKHSCRITAFGWLSLNAGDSFLKDIEKR